MVFSLREREASSGRGRQFCWSLACAVCLCGCGLPPARLSGSLNKRDRGNEVLPVVFQDDSLGCGVAAVAMLLAHAHMAVPYSQLRREVEPGRALSLAELGALASHHGLTTHGVLATAREIGSLAIPWIAHLKSGIGHYVVVERSFANEVLVADPASGRMVYAKREFSQQWDGYGLVIDGTSAIR